VLYNNCPALLLMLPAATALAFVAPPPSTISHSPTSNLQTPLPQSGI